MKSIIVHLFILTFPFGLLGQKPKIVPVDEFGKEIIYDSTQWMSDDDRKFLNTIEVNYKKSNSFNQVNGLECFEEYPKLQSMIACAGNKLQSIDDQVVIFIPLYRFLNKHDSVDIKASFPLMEIPSLNDHHNGQIRAIILNSLGKDASVKGENADFDWRKYVTYYKSKDAHKKFNADTAITFDIKLDKDNYYQNKYMYLKALFIQKNGQGFVNFYCLYTEQAKKHFIKYWKAIESTLKYEE